MNGHATALIADDEPLLRDALRHARAQDAAAHGIPQRYTAQHGLFEDQHLKRDGSLAAVNVRTQEVDVAGQEVHRKAEIVLPFC